MKRNTRSIRRKMLQVFLRDFGNTTYHTPRLVEMQKRHNAIIRAEIRRA